MAITTETINKLAEALKSGETDAQKAHRKEREAYLRREHARGLAKEAAAGYKPRLKQTNENDPRAAYWGK